jgi:hypothetical protein
MEVLFVVQGGHVVQLVDTYVSEAYPARVEGSSPSMPTKLTSGTTRYQEWDWPSVLSSLII